MNDPTNERFDDGTDGDSLDLFGFALPEKIERPFDPQQIKISRRIVPVSLIVKRIDFGEIDLAPDFQRRARIWDTARKSRLIESMLLRIPLPVFYVAADDEENWRVVDGLQRLTTIHDFVKSASPTSFVLKSLEYLQAYEGASFATLPRSIKRRIEETELNINVIESGTPDEVMFNVFKRINTGGITLNGQEIRHALNPGPARDFLSLLAGLQEFRAATAESVNDERMAARELALRFTAFHLTSPDKYTGSDLDGFLNQAMKTLNRISDQERDAIRSSFQIAMGRAESLFGDEAFRKRTIQNAQRGPINRALFEAWSVNLAELTDAQFLDLLRKGDRLQESFTYRLNVDSEFMASISQATGSRNKVLKRFKIIRELIESVLYV